MNIVKIDELKGLESQAPAYVEKQLNQRIKDIKALPSPIKSILSQSQTLLDVGPGEGISSMALAENYSDLNIIGLEMDRKHLTGAWPICNGYDNLSLYFGALPGTPSNKKIDGDASIPQIKDYEADTLFTWTGMSRKDIFENNANWLHVVKDTAVFLVPKFWREGSKSLETIDQVEGLLSKLNTNMNHWDEVTSINGFSHFEVYPTEHKLSARGWILWLSGVFDDIDISFWNTLTDRWREQLYQLSDMNLPLEFIVAKK